MTDELPRVCPGCGFNRWRTTRTVRRTMPSKRTPGELETELVEIALPKHEWVCTVCENAARRKQFPLTGRVFESDL